ncbi:MAG: glycosyltransferase, partial [Bacteroidota bacterium]
GHEVRMFVYRKTTGNPAVVEIRPYFRQMALYILTKYINRKYRPVEMFSYMCVRNQSLVNAVNQFGPDIVHIHWVGKHMMGPGDIARLNAPVFWSLHDMNPFTGGCHYSKSCEGFKSVCGNCPVLRSKHEHDFSSKQVKIKLKAFGSKTVTFIGLSQWMTEQAAASTIGKQHKSVNLPTFADLSVFKPAQKKEYKDGKIRILFTAASGTTEYRKGFDLLVLSLQFLDSGRFSLKIVCDSLHPALSSLDFQTEILKPTDDDNILASYYRQADMVVVPSREENFSNVIIEALACGLPVTAFRTGGNADLIIHRHNGFLVDNMDEQSLAEGIEWVAGNLDRHHLSDNARNSMETRFSPENVSKRYINLFHQTLSGQNLIITQDE